MVTALRRDGEDRSVHVGGYRWSHLHEWAQSHPRAWVEDPAGAVVYEAHHYVDTTSTAGSRSGTYGTGSGRALRYATELAAARASTSASASTPAPPA